VESVLSTLDALYMEYGDDRYRASIFLRKMLVENSRFYS